MIVNQQTLCDILGKTQPWVHAMQKKGLPIKQKGVKGKSNEYDTAEVIDWILHGENIDYQKERARLTKAQADAEEMKTAKMKDELVSIDEVRDKVTQEYSNVRARLLALPSAAVVSLVGVDEPAKQKDIISGLIKEALAELSDG